MGTDSPPPGPPDEPVSWQPLRPGSVVPSPRGQGPYGQEPYRDASFGRPTAYGSAQYLREAYLQEAYVPQASAPGCHPAEPSGGRGSPPARWTVRVAAHVIDDLVVRGVLYLALVFWTMSATVTSGIGPIGHVTGDPTAGRVVLLLGCPAALGLWIWNRVIRQGRTGRSIGKSMLGIRLVSEVTGRPVGQWVALGRDVAHVVDGVLDIGYLRPLWHARQQTFADTLCGTRVVRD